MNTDETPTQMTQPAELPLIKCPECGEALQPKSYGPFFIPEPAYRIAYTCPNNCQRGPMKDSTTEALIAATNTFTPPAAEPPWRALEPGEKAQIGDRRNEDYSWQTRRPQPAAPPDSGQAPTEPEPAHAKCPSCGGTGDIYNNRPEPIEPTLPCPDCEGTGKEKPAPAQTAREWLAKQEWDDQPDYVHWRYATQLADRADRAEAELAAKKEELADEWRRGWRKSCMRIAAKLVSIGCPSDGVVDGVDWLVAEHIRLREALERIEKCEDAPDIDATGEWQVGLHCGVEDRNCRDQYEGADFGHTVGVEKALEWAVNEARAALNQTTNEK